MLTADCSVLCINDAYVRHQSAASCCSLVIYVRTLSEVALFYFNWHTSLSPWARRWRQEATTGARLRRQRPRCRTLMSTTTSDTTSWRTTKTTCGDYARSLGTSWWRSTVTLQDYPSISQFLAMSMTSATAESSTDLVITTDRDEYNHWWIRIGSENMATSVFSSFHFRWQLTNWH